MGNNWFETKVRYEKVAENGMAKKVTESYLVNALSHAEAEARIIEEMTPYIKGELAVSSVRRMNYCELFQDESAEANRWYKAKFAFLTINEKIGVEKKTTANVLVQAKSIRQALESVDKNMKDALSDYEIVSIAETAIMDVYHYLAPESRNEEANETEKSVSRAFNLR